MAKNPNKEAAEEALRLIKEEAEIRARMNSSYDEYVKAVKEAHAIQKTLTKNLQIQNDVQAKVNALKANVNRLSGQAKIDADGDGKITGKDFAMLRSKKKTTKKKKPSMMAMAMKGKR